MAAATSKQLPPSLDFEFVAGDVFTRTVTATGATITSPVVTLKTGGGDPYPTDPGQPTVGQVGAVTTIAFSAADTAALNTGRTVKTYQWSLQATVDGDGPHQLIARNIKVHPVGSSIPSQSTSPISLAVTVGGTDIALEVTLGALVGNIDGGSFDSVYGGTSGVDGGTF